MIETTETNKNTTMKETTETTETAETDEMLRPLVVHERDAEVVPLPGGGRFLLLEDSLETVGLLGANRLVLPPGADGTRPHHHKLSTEIFYVLSGTMEFLLCDELTPVGRGGLVVVPPGTVHAFGAAHDGPAEFFATLTPGIVRFEYFRQLGRIARGEADWDTMDALHDQFDVHFCEGPAWR